MRASHPGGRFTVESEIDRYWDGISEDLQRPVGGEVPWYRFDLSSTTVDDVYDVGAAGRVWESPRPLKYIVAQVFQGETFQNDRGFYNADVLRLTISMQDILLAFPDFTATADSFLKDRVIFNGKPFRPTRIYQKGRVLDRYTVITMDLIEEKAEENVNDPQFQEYSDPGAIPSVQVYPGANVYPSVGLVPV